MKIKKIIASILLTFIALTTFTPLANAVTFNGSTKVNFPWIQWVWQYFGENIDGKELWTTKEDERINNVTSMVCIENWPEDSCLTYVMNVTQFFVIDLKKEYYSDNEGVWGITLTESVRNYISFNVWEKNEKWEQWENDIYFNYQIWEKKWNLVKISKNQKCGTDNPHICVIGLNTFITYSAKGTTRGVYWTYSDITVYSDENDNIRVHRAHKDKSDGKQVWFFQHILQDIAQYKGGYGARVWDIDDGEEIFISDKIYTDDSYENDKREIIYMKVDKWYWRFLKYEQYTRLTTEKLPRLSANGATLGQKSWEIYEKSRVLIPLMNEYLWDSHSQVDKNTKLNVFSTLRDVFNFKWINSSEHNGTSANPRNHDWLRDDDGFLICWTIDIWCHIKNFVKAFYNAILDFWNKIFWDSWSLVESESEWSWILSNLMRNAFVKWDVALWLNQKLICDAKFNYSFTEWEKNFIDQNYRKYVPEDSFVYTLFGLFKFMNPIPPNDWEEICTYSWMKQIHYRENSWIDIVLVIIFCGMILGLFYRNYN